MSKQNKKTIGLLATILSIVLMLCLMTLLPILAENPDLENTYYTVTVSSNIGSLNQTSVSVDGNVKNEDGQFCYKTSVTLTAVAGTGYRFEKWVEDNTIEGTTSPNAVFSFQVTQDSSYTAYFVPIEYDIQITPDERIQYVSGKEPPSTFRHTYGSETLLPEPKDTFGYIFDGWLVESGETQKFIAKDESGMKLGAQEYSDSITLTAKFSPISFDITCQDKTTTNISLGTSTFQAAFDEKNVPATRAPERIYRGYYFVADVCDYTSVPSVSANSSQNRVERIYKPKTYKIIYENCTPEGGTAQSYTYGTVATILIPKRDGYKFLGWTVDWYEKDGTLTSQKQFDYNGNSFTIGEEDYDNPNWNYYDNQSNADLYAIRLTARWEAIPYNVVYQNVEGVSKPQLDELPQNHYMDKPFVLDAVLSKKGYVFLGWKIEGMNDYEASLSLNPGSRPFGDLEVYAGWKAITYDVTLDPNGGSGGDTTIKVTYDQPFPDQFVKPTLAGHTFIGYDYVAEDGSTTRYYYYDEASQTFKSRAWDIAVPEGKTITLVARWQRNNYNVTVNSDLLDLADVKLTVNGVDYPYVKGVTETFSFEYRSVITVTVSVKGNGKLVGWGGQAIAHTELYTVTLDPLAEDITLNGVVLTELAKPTFGIDYAKELFTNAAGSTTLPAGNYKLLVGSAEPIYFTVSAEGLITFAADSSTASALKIEPYFGKEVKIVLCGNGETNADSDAQIISVAGRPAAPKLNLEIDFITPLDSSIRIIMKYERVDLFEFACSPIRVEDGITGLTYGDSLIFDQLASGTPYYIYIRFKSSENNPHGEAYVEEVFTLNEQYLQTQIDKLMNLKETGDGENVGDLLSRAENEMKDLQPSPNYETDMQKIYDRVKTEILLARVKDQRIAELLKICKDYQESDRDDGYAYSNEAGIPALETHFTNAKLAINAAKTENEVQRLFLAAKENFNAVKISYLFQGDMISVYHSLGMDRNYKIAASRIADLATISQQIHNAISAGTIVVGGTQMTLAEAAKMLPTLDVLAYYNLRLTNGETVITKYEGLYEIKLLIPEDLRSEQGLLVAYYQSTNEELTVLDTRREGNYLIFTADSVTNFVILGDHTVNLTGLLIALSATLLVQIIAIALMLISRIKHAKAMRNYSFSLLTLALTVRFLPNNSTSVAIVLAVLVGVLQIVLLWLLLTSEFVTRRTRTHTAQSKPVQEPVPAPQITESEAEPVPEEEEAYLTALAGGMVAEELFEQEDDPIDLPTEAESDFSDAASFEPDTEELFDDSVEEDWYGDNSFIEPATVSRYSLPDEEWEQGSDEQGEGEFELTDDPETEYSEEYSEEYVEPQEEYFEESGEEVYEEYPEPQEESFEESGEEYAEGAYAEEYDAPQEEYTEVYGNDPYTYEYDTSEDENAELNLFEETEEDLTDSEADFADDPEEF